MLINRNVKYNQYGCNLNFIELEKIKVHNELKFFAYVKYFCNQFMEMEFYKGLDLIEFADFFKCDISKGTVISHKNGIALCKTDEVSQLSLMPMIRIGSKDIEKEVYFYYDGHFNIKFSNSNPIFLCKDISKEQEFFIIWLANRLEKYWETLDNVIGNTTLSIAIDKDLSLKFKNLKEEVLNKKKLLLRSEVEDFYRKYEHLSINDIVLKGCLHFHTNEQHFKHVLYQII